MPFFGMSINVVSLFAFIVVLGIVVDDAIIVLENIRRKFGHEAMIMGSRKFRTGGFLGFGSREMVEVYVADTTVQVESLKSGRGAFSSPARSPEPVREVDETLISRPPIREQEQLEKLQALSLIHI